MLTMHRKAALAGLLALSLAALFLVSGCAGNEAGAPLATPSSPAATPSSAAPPTMELVQPLQGDTVPAGELPVKVETTGHKFTMASNTNVPGEGHVHYTLDDRPFVMSITPDTILENVEPGEHTLIAELVQNNTQPFDPPVRQEITFTAE